MAHVRSRSVACVNHSMNPPRAIRAACVGCMHFLTHVRPAGCLFVVGDTPTAGWEARVNGLGRVRR